MRVYAIPMTTRFRGITVREGALVEGAAGWGEWSPFLEYPPEEAEPWLRCAEEAAAGDWPEPVRDRGAGERHRARASRPEQAHALVRRLGLRDRQGQGRRPRQRRWPTTSPGSRRSATRWARPAGSASTPTAPGTSTTPSPPSRALDRAAGGLEYVEQPCASVEDLAAVRRRVDVPIAADESIRRAADPYRVRDLEAADIAVLKVQPLGGVRACLRIAEDIGMPVVVSSALETSLGLAAGVALAAALPELDHACGLATRSLLTGRRRDARAASRSTGMLPVARPAVVPDARRGVARRRPTGWPGGRTGWRRCGPCGRVVTRDVVHRAGRAPSSAAWSRAGSARSCSRRARATRRWRSRRTTPPRPGLLRLHTRLDERSAGFLALGLTKVGSRAAVICTSGTAVANLHPALLEAAHAGVPLVAVTADRPDAAARHRRQPDHRPGRPLRPPHPHRRPGAPADSP